MKNIEYYRHLLANAFHKFSEGEITDKEFDKRIDTYVAPRRETPAEKKRRDMKKYKNMYSSSGNVSFSENGIPYSNITGKTLIGSYRTKKTPSNGKYFSGAWCNSQNFGKTSRQAQRETQNIWETATETLDDLTTEEQYAAIEYFWED